MLKTLRQIARVGIVTENPPLADDGLRVREALERIQSAAGELEQRIGEVDSAFGSDQRGRVGLLPGVVLTVQSATQIVLAPVGAVAQELSE